MKKILVTMMSVLLMSLSSETLFEVKDASNQKVFDVSDDGMRVYNLGDTLMVISATGIQANIGRSKGLSRSFSVTTSSIKGSNNDIMRLTSDSTRFWISDTGSGFGVAKQTGLKSGETNLLEVSSSDTKMREGSAGSKYTDFSTYNIFMGLNSGVNTLPSIYSGNNNVFIGNQTGIANTYGKDNVFIGAEAGYANIDGNFNIFLGYNSGRMNESGDRNVFVGYESGQANKTGTSNTFVGEASGTRNIGGHYNSFYGKNSGAENTEGDFNTSAGYQAYGLNVTGNYNSCFGAESGYYNQSGNNNSIFGYQAGKGVWGTSNSNNCFFGYQSGFSVTSGTGNVFLGYQAGYNETTSNKLYIDNSNTSLPLIWGDFDSDYLKINGDFAVKNHSTFASYDVTGSAVIAGTLKVGTGAVISKFSIDGTMAGNSDSNVPTEKAVRTYVTASKDNLGNHTATQNIKLSGYYLSNDGGNEGVYVDTDGDVGIGTNSPGSNRVKVVSGTAINNVSGATGYFENTYSAGMGLAALATSTDVALYAEQKNTSSTTANIAKFASMYGGTWHESVVFKNSGAIIANNLSTGSGTALHLTSGNEIVKLSSSKKYKKDIEPLVVSHEKFMKLQPVSFKWNEKTASENVADCGLIAEDVEKIDPELAVYNSEGSIEGVNYQKLNIMILKVVQEHQNEIDELKKQIAELKNMIKK